jgi:hypothetical protein
MAVAPELQKYYLGWPNGLFDEGVQRKIVGCELCPFKFSASLFQLAVYKGQQQKETAHQ